LATTRDGTLMQQARIVRYWHAVELLQPQSPPKLKKRGGLYSAFIHDTSIQRPVVPWTPASELSKQALPEKRVWSHTLFAYLYDSRRVAEKLKDVYGADQGYQEPQSRKSALFAAKFTMLGHYVPDSFVLSSEAWFLGRVLTGKDWTRGFDADQRTIADHATTLLEGTVSDDALRGLTRSVLDRIGVANFFGEMDAHAFRFRSQPVNPEKPMVENDPLNSFLLDDLADVADSIERGEVSKPLDQYLRRHESEPRRHIDDDRESLGLIERLMPDAYPMGCWPSEKHHGLVHSQQLAVNTILSSSDDAQALLGINGPPGTGKTTLLRDLIAAIVTRRADALAALPRASGAFLSDGREDYSDGGKANTCFKLDPALYGFEIVVASSNNGAVENVTLELPQRDKVDESWLPEAEYFAELGELVSGKPAWGLISGALGSKARRTRFVSRYFYGQRPIDKAASSETDDTQADVEDESEDELSTASSIKDGAASRSDRGQPLKETPTGPQGFLGWITECAETNKRRNPEQRQIVWRQAVADYAAAKADVNRASAAANRIRALVQALCQHRQTADKQSNALDELEGKLADQTQQQTRLDEDEDRVIRIVKQRLDALEVHHARKPGFWANVFSLWAARKDWDRKCKLLDGQYDLARADVDRATRQRKQLVLSRESLEKQATGARLALQRLHDQCHAQTQTAIDVASACQAEHVLAWLRSDVIGRGDSIELAEPWQIEGWRQARARVFIQALKLHRIFFELEASRIRANLYLANALLTGSRYQDISRDAIRSAWASLFMVVPVLSSTFASFARSFGSLKSSEIGWLLVDEAGQASPQAAVGALWRSRRALLVGDPLQLKPILTVSDAVLEHMRTRYEVDPHWLPNRHSAQTLADQATILGRMAGPAAAKTWVGLPLVVHRRCDSPMHTLANRIAYDGAMVYGTLAPRPGKETPARIATGWIHARGKSEENWIPAEGEALQNLLVALEADGVKTEDISVITPFKTVQEQLSRLLRGKIASGTVHTMQGKEAPVIIMVLGGSTENAGARDWAVSEPNLLNVAATRAKRRFYVIGDRDDWRNRALFCDVMDLLPAQTVPIREPGLV